MKAWVRRKRDRHRYYRQSEIYLEISCYRFVYFIERCVVTVFIFFFFSWINSFLLSSRLNRIDNSKRKKAKKKKNYFSIHYYFQQTHVVQSEQKASEKKSKILGWFVFERKYTRKYTRKYKTTSNNNYWNEKLFEIKTERKMRKKSYLFRCRRRVFLLLLLSG